MPSQLTNLAYNDTRRLDLHLVDEPGRPLVVCLHGGGFIGGDRNDERCRQAVSLLIEAGFNCASVSYSLAPADNRFAMWPRNLFDVADAITFLHAQSAEHTYDCGRFGMLGFSAGCCLSNLYIQGGTALFKHFGYQTPLFRPAALVGFYGPYDFPSRQPERRSDNAEVNRYHSPSYWLRNSDGPTPPPVLHIQGDRDTIVYPDQHHAFKADCEQRGYSFKALLAEGFGHSFAPEATNSAGVSIDLRKEITAFFERHLAGSST
jgi:acetyl esterase/lipase